MSDLSDNQIAQIRCKILTIQETQERYGKEDSYSSHQSGRFLHDVALLLGVPFMGGESSEFSEWEKNMAVDSGAGKRQCSRAE